MYNFSHYLDMAGFIQKKINDIYNTLFVFLSVRKLYM
jgi:hypothetical protein